MMSVTYRFSSMSALADYCDTKAVDARNKTAHRKLDKFQHIGEASAWESAADLIRNTVIEEEKKP